MQVEIAAMAAHSDGVEVETKARGGFMEGLRRSVLGGESFFINTFRSPSGGSVSVARALPGDMTADFVLWLVPKLPTQRE